MTKERIEEEEINEEEIDKKEIAEEIKERIELKYIEKSL